METVQIVTTSSDNYAKYTAVMLTSMLENKRSNNPININIIGILSENIKSKLNNSLERYGIKINFFDIDPSLFEGFKLTMHFTKEIYYRILIPDLLNTDVHKAIYLDSDIILNEDITELWNINVEDYFLAAVNEFNNRRHRALSLPTKKGMYFNSGVMVINLDKWRENNTSKAVVDYLMNNEKIIIFPDQDALNAVLYSKWLSLDMKWNFTTELYKRLKKEKSIRNQKNDFMPAIIHFTGKKPWNTGHKLQNEYFKYESITIWNQDHYL